MKKLLISLLLFLLIAGTEKLIPKELLENIEILKELEFFIFMDIIEKEVKMETQKKQEKDNKKEIIKKIKDIEVSTVTIHISTNTLNINNSTTTTRRNYEE